MRHYQPLGQQSGVALIQSLLVVSMILILVVQLSKQSQQQVRTAIALKQKVQALVELDNVNERLKFALLTESRIHNNASLITKSWNFYNKPFSVGNVQVELQDEAGLVSLPFNTDYLQLLLKKGSSDNRGKEISQIIKNLQQWQGQNEEASIPEGWRGGYMQYSAELHQVPGWKNIKINNELLTYFPMYYFNPANAPDTLLSELAKLGKSEELLKKRANGSLGKSELNALTSFDFSNEILDTSEYVRVKVSVEMEDWTLVRTFKYYISPKSIKPLLQFGY